MPARPSLPLDAALGGEDGAVRLAVRVQPGAKRSAVLGMHGERLRIAVAAPPVDGKANAELERFVADLLGVPARRVRVVAGQTARDKRLEVDASLGEVRARLADAVPR